MAIPAFNEHGFLPEGIHDCTVAEIHERFGQFQRTDQRCRLFARLESFLHEMAATGFVRAVILDGSFVTAEAAPNDIDLILVLTATHNFNASLRPFEYNVVSKWEVRRRHGFDVVIVRERSEVFDQAVEFFTRVRERPSFRKGLLRISV